MSMEEGDFKALVPIKDVPVSPATSIAALALNFALQYHNINTVQDGALYQQYKLEGKNMRELQLNDVFETAIKMEAHLITANQRIADILVEVLEDAAAAAEEEKDDADVQGSDPRDE